MKTDFLQALNAMKDSKFDLIAEHPAGVTSLEEVSEPVEAEAHLLVNEPIEMVR